MSIRRDLLLRTALLRLPEVPERGDARPAVPAPAKDLPADRRPAPRRARAAAGQGLTGRRGVAP
jgi:hypothetical protein